MKALMVCAAGQNRSHSLVLQAKTMWQWDALAAGIYGNPSVFPMLSAWADRIVLVERWWPEHFIPQEHHHKVAWLEMGTDVWGSPVHPELMILAKDLLIRWEKSKFRPGILFSKSGIQEDIIGYRPGIES